MLYLYDHAFEKKLRKVFPRVVYAPVDEFYQRYFLQENSTDSIELPALSLWRLSHEFNPYSARSHLNTPSMQNVKLPKSELQQIYSMQIPLNYQLDIWANNDIDRDDLFTELMYFLTAYPDISIVYEGREIAFPIHLEAADDVTDVTNFESNGDLYRISIPCRVPDARLFYYRDVKYCKYLDIDFSLDDKDHQKIEIGR